METLVTIVIIFVLFVFPLIKIVYDTWASRKDERELNNLVIKGVSYYMGLIHRSQIDPLIDKLDLNNHLRFSHEVVYRISRLNIQKEFLIRLIQRKKIDYDQNLHFFGLDEKFKNDPQIILEYIKNTNQIKTFFDFKDTYHEDTKIIDAWITYNGNINGLPSKLRDKQEILDKCFEINKSNNNYIEYFKSSKTTDHNFIIKFVDMLSRIGYPEIIKILDKISLNSRNDDISINSLFKKIPEFDDWLKSNDQEDVDKNKKTDEKKETIMIEKFDEDQILELFEENYDFNEVEIQRLKKVLNKENIYSLVEKKGLISLIEKLLLDGMDEESIIHDIIAEDFLDYDRKELEKAYKMLQAKDLIYAIPSESNQYNSEGEPDVTVNALDRVEREHLSRYYGHRMNSYVWEEKNEVSLENGFKKNELQKDKYNFYDTEYNYDENTDLEEDILELDPSEDDLEMREKRIEREWEQHQGYIDEFEDKADSLKFRFGREFILEALVGLEFTKQDLIDLGFSGCNINIAKGIENDVLKLSDFITFDIKSKTITGYYHNLFNSILEIPNKIYNTEVKLIGNTSFRDSNLEKVVLPNSITHIGEGAFFNNKIKEIILPNELQYIGRSAFGKNKIRSLEIPKGLKEICKDAFRLNDLESIYILGDETRFNDRWEEIGFPNELMPEYKKKASFNRSVEVQEIDQAQFIPNILEGKQIVITGTLKHFTRETIKETISSLGGKVQSSITSNTDYVIKGFENTGSKLDKAKEKNILIKDEEAFLKEITQIKTDEYKSENNDIKDRLKKLRELLEEDLITEDEYNVKREQILKEL